MKKIIVAFILTIILLTNTITILAVEFPEMGMKIEVPEEYYDLKAGVDKNDTKLTYYETVLKTTKDELKSQYTQNGIVYNGISSNLSKELIIAVIENAKTKMNQHLTSLNDAEIEYVKQEIVNAANGAQKQEQEVYEKNGIKYIYTIFKSGTTTIYQYYTIVNGRAITITLNSKYSNVKQEELKEIVDTIQFDEILEKPSGIVSNPILFVGIILVILIIVLVTIAIVRKTKNKEN